MLELSNIKKSYGDDGNRGGGFTAHIISFDIRNHGKNIQSNVKTDDERMDGNMA